MIKKVAQKNIYLGLLILLGGLLISHSALAYSEVVYDGTNVPTVSHGDCLILYEDPDVLGTPPNVSGTNFNFSGTGYISNTGGGMCNLTNAQFTTKLNDFCFSRSDDNYVWEYGENALFPFTADYWGSFNCLNNAWSYSAPESCIDGILNQDETAIDYGGVCGDYLTNESHINILTPLPSDTKFSPVTFSGKFAQQSTAWDNILLYIYNNDTEEGQTILVPISTDYNLDGSWSTSVSLPDADYYVVARLYKSTNYTFGSWYPSENSSAVSFHVGEISAPINCDTLDFGCYLKSAFTWAFTISPTTLQSFSNLTLENSAPFSYIYDIGTLYNELFANSGSSDIDIAVNTPIGQITFLNKTMINNIPYTSTIKTILGALLYLFTAMTVYKLVLNGFHTKV